MCCLRLWGCSASIALGKLQEQWDVCIQALLFMPAACSLFRQLSPAAQRGLGCPSAGQACGGSAQGRPAGPGQERVTMAAEPPQSPVTEAVRSLEVRWIFPGQLEAAVAGWFGRFPAGTESREDTYLLDPQLPGLSVKIRGSGALEVKAYRGSPGILEVAGRARGRMEAWQKWSFRLSPLRPGSGDPPGGLVNPQRIVQQQPDHRRRPQRLPATITVGGRDQGPGLVTVQADRACRGSRGRADRGAERLALAVRSQWHDGPHCPRPPVYRIKAAGVAPAAVIANLQLTGPLPLAAGQPAE
jgi:hypothetical protein